MKRIALAGLALGLAGAGCAPIVAEGYYEPRYDPVPVAQPAFGVVVVRNSYWPGYWPSYRPGYWDYRRGRPDDHHGYRDDGRGGRGHDGKGHDVKGHDVKGRGGRDEGRPGGGGRQVGERGPGGDQGRDQARGGEARGGEARGGQDRGGENGRPRAGARPDRDVAGGGGGAGGRGAGGRGQERPTRAAPSRDEDTRVSRRDVQPNPRRDGGAGSFNR